MAVLDEQRNIIEQIKFPTPKQYDEFKVVLEQNVANFATKDFTAGGVGVRGNIDREAGMSLKDDVLDWGPAPVRADCENIFNCEFVLENDSKLAGLSEARLVKEFRKVLYITISTGIGSAFVIDGNLDPDTLNSEIGKGVYEHNGKVQQWEDFASGKAIVATYNMRASEIEDPATWREISINLAFGLIDAAVAFTPDLIILGGGVGTHYSKFQEPLREVIAELKPAEIIFPEIRQAQHPEEAVIYGCFELARDTFGHTR